jgi:myo-inositol 2-dehydrogenase / D-chiro-inositol 1-dehydrogenase
LPDTAIALAGTGHMATMHALVAEQTPGVRVTRVATRTPEAPSGRAGRLGGRLCGYDELPAGADVVVVTTPPARHASDALASLARGAAVILEKPLATTLAQADALVEAAGPRLGYAENLAFAPVVTRAVALAHQLGPLHHVDARLLRDRPAWGGFLTEAWGGGVLFDLGAHPLALVLLLADAGPTGADRVVGVQAHLEGEDEVAVDTYAEVRLTFASGLRGTVEASWRARDAVLDFQAAADGGVVRGEMLPGLVIEHNGQPQALPPARPGLSNPQIEQFGYLGQLTGFVDDFAAGRQPEMDAAFGRLVLEVICAAYASAGAAETVVPLPFSGARDRTPLELWRPA